MIKIQEIITVDNVDQYKEKTRLGKLTDLPTAARIARLLFNIFTWVDTYLTSSPSPPLSKTDRLYWQRWRRISAGWFKGKGKLLNLQIIVALGEKPPQKRMFSVGQNI